MPIIFLKKTYYIKKSHKKIEKRCFTLKIPVHDVPGRFSFNKKKVFSIRESFSFFGEKQGSLRLLLSNRPSLKS